ncbi:hypothetical protein [Rosenbergiella epipactidis]|uniref:hypothetical protein n=1 Tax=Rosenbergiella epipactidis TaxID=1544694 RepID=UPI001F4DA904|nr:hypothetical protein [Rosenbergiella epipactidis]
MAQAGLPLDKGHDYIAVKVEGIPLGRYAPQIFQLLSQHGLDAVRRMLAQPVLSDQGIALQWFPHRSNQVITPWCQATLSQQVDCLAQLMERIDAITTLRQQLAGQRTRSLTIIDQILQNLTVIPSTEAIFLADQQPLLAQWGHYNQERTAVDLPSLHQLLQQHLEEESAAAQAPAESLPSKRPCAPYRYSLSVAVITLFIAGAITITTLRSRTTPPIATLPHIISTVDKVQQSVKGVMIASQALPLRPAELTLPPPELIPIRVKKSRVPLMIPARSRYQGNIDFLNGTWLANLRLDNTTAAVTFDFSHGKANTHIAFGQQTCTTTSQSGFTSSGKLIIKTAKARCDEDKMLPIITLVCEKSAPNTQCRWQQNPSTLLPVELYSERTL